MKDVKPASAAVSNGTWKAILLCGLALMLRLPGLGTREFWIDEGLTYLQLKEGVFPGIPPMHFYLIRPFVFLLGPTAFAMRLPSVLADLFFIGASALLVRRCFTERIAWITAILMTFSPYLVYYAQEARYYAALNFILAALYLATERYLGATAPSHRWAVAMSSLSLVAFLLHYLALIPIAGIIFLLILASWRHRDQSGLIAAAFIIAPILITIMMFFDARVLSMLEVASPNALTASSLAPGLILVESIKKFIYLLYVYLAGFIHMFTFFDHVISNRLSTVIKLLPVGSALLLCLIGLRDAFRPGRKRGYHLTALAFVGLGYLTLLFAEFVFHFYSFQSRHLSFIILPLFLLIAAGIDSLWARFRLLLMIIVLPLAVFFMGGLIVYHRSTVKAGMEGWSPIVKEIARTQGDHAILVSHYFYPAIAYYRDRFDTVATIYQYPVTWRDHGAGKNIATDDEIDSLLHAASRHPSLWVVDGRTGFSTDSTIYSYISQRHNLVRISTYTSGQGSSYSVPTVVHQYAIKDSRDSAVHDNDQ